MAYKSINPATNELIQEYSQHDDAFADRALSRAHQLYKSDWSKGAIAPRVQMLKRLADSIDAHAEELAHIASTEMGKLIGQSRSEVKLSAQIARYYAENAERFLAPVPYPSELGDAWVENHPIGVLMAVEPWNFPYYQLMRVVAPNLAAGNPILMKHASIVPHCAERFEQLVNEAGAPPGAYTNLFISSGQVARLIDDERIQGVALTGSEKAGASVAAAAGKNVKKSTLELGGNDVFIVLEDSPLDFTVKNAVSGRLDNAGQVCTASKRFIVHEKIASGFIDRLAAAFTAVKIGDPLDETTELGPLSSKEALEGLTAQVNKAKEHGAKVVCGGKPVERSGNFYQPTILTQIQRDNPAYFEEFFGPVAQVYVVKDDDEAVKLANDSHYGLGGAIFTQDIQRAKTMASRIETGMVYINSPTGTAAELPFGGVKRSGYGRELSDLGIKEFVNQKLIVVAKQ
ncbi:NAD-dependent succinate-semialdehyde dehydrogenase [Sodalis sp. RH21]|uniref:NAD-dependent succinate-semialdehyde dehydrogenase n=1 Tax=unclassified Sodalis (in: enterobacteria) TaxID=2636512 RepID=UPI0039B4C015